MLAKLPCPAYSTPAYWGKGRINCPAVVVGDDIALPGAELLANGFGTDLAMEAAAIARDCCWGLPA